MKKKSQKCIVTRGLTIKSIGVLFFYLGCVLPRDAIANNWLTAVKVNITLQQPTCDIKNQQGSTSPISVDFGDILVSKVNGIEYEKNIPFILDCPNAAPVSVLKLSLSGTGATFNSQLLAVNDEPQLGLRFKSNGNNFPLGGEVYFQYSSKPSLTVVPVVGNKSGLKGGNFTASSTLTVDYM